MRLAGVPGADDHSLMMILQNVGPDIILSPDAKGRLMIHYLCRYNGHCHETLKVMTLCAPSCAWASYPGQEGLLPLHILCRYYQPEWRESARLLLGAHPAAATTSDTRGCTPLHYACAGGADEELLRALVAAGPEAAKRADEEGYVPLHYAAELASSLGSLALLKRAHPAAVMAETCRGETPVDCLLRNPRAAGESALRLLLDPDP